MRTKDSHTISTYTVNRIRIRDIHSPDAKIAVAQFIFEDIYRSYSGAFNVNGIGRRFPCERTIRDAPAVTGKITWQVMIVEVGRKRRKKRDASRADGMIRALQMGPCVHRSRSLRLPTHGRLSSRKEGSNKQTKKPLKTATKGGKQA